ncbi:MAG: PRC-barrel domain-containing protein [Vicinamibacterales bacterium]|nr:PRC-barrel domain-containing protein [Vicinamibacterales bacterium]
MTRTDVTVQTPPPGRPHLLRNANDLRRFAVLATDGAIGQVEDMYFDDEGWTLRYFAVDTGRWLSGRRVLISPLAVGPSDWLTQQVPVALTKVQVERSPDIDTQKPVSRQHEADQLSYYGLPYYWSDDRLAGMVAYPTLETVDAAPRLVPPPGRPRAREESHLRSCKAVTGYEVHAVDGNIGHVADFLVDDETWAIRYLVVETGHWWAGQQVLVAPRWVNAVNWPDSMVTVGLTQRAVRHAPPYDPSVQLDRQMEAGLHEHYGRPGYWSD